MKGYALILSLVLVLAVACAPCAYTPAGAPCLRTSEMFVDPAFTSSEREDIARAVGAWTRALGGRECFALVERESGADVRVVRAETRQDVIDPHTSEPNIAGLWAPTPRRISIVIEEHTDTELATIAAHEIGHYLGLPHAHAASGASVINAVLSDDFPITEGAEIPALDVRAYELAR